MLVLTVVGFVAPAVRADPAKAALNRTLPAATFDNVPIGDALDFLRDVSGANLHVDWRALASINVSKDTPVNVKLRAVPLRKTLALLLSETGAGDLLTFYVDQGVIEVTTREVADRQLFTKVYPVGDLLMEVPDFEGPGLSLSGGSGGRGSNGGASSRGGGGASGFGGGGSSASGEKDGKSKTERGKELVALIVETIQPDIWRDNGGTASIRFFNDNLVVTAPRSVHEAIGGPID